MKKETKGRGLSAGVRARVCRHREHGHTCGERKGPAVSTGRRIKREKRRAGAGGGLGEERGRVCFD